jgi:uncharacterized protein (DUF1697 family)
MVSYAALLRAVNVGGRNLIGMSELRAFAEQLKLNDPRTLLQSGNLVFKSVARPTADLERLLESEAAARLDLETNFMVRIERTLGTRGTGRNWNTVVKLAALVAS